MTAERAARFAHSLALVRPLSRRRLYWTARAVFVREPAHVRAFDRGVAEVFGAGARSEGEQAASASDTAVLRRPTSASAPSGRRRRSRAVRAPARRRERARRGEREPGEKS